MQGEDPTSVVLDTNVIIDLTKLAVLDLVCRLPGYSFIVVDEVFREVTRPGQIEALARVLDSRLASRVSLTEPDELALYAALHLVLDTGEAASLAFAAHRRLAIASDEKRPKFMREVGQAVGKARLIRTADLLAQAIRDGCLDWESLSLRLQQLRMTAASPRERSDVAHLERVLQDVYGKVGEEYAP